MLFDNRWNQHTYMYTGLTLLPFGLWAPDIIEKKKYKDKSIAKNVLYKHR